LTMSSWSTPLRRHISSSSSMVRSWTCASSSTSTVVAPRRARRATGTVDEPTRPASAVPPPGLPRRGGGGPLERPDLVLAERAPLPRLQGVVGDRPDAGAHQADHRGAHGLAHATDLPVAALVDREAQHPVVELGD